MTIYDFEQKRQQRLAAAMEIILKNFRRRVSAMCEDVSDRESAIEDLFMEAESSDNFIFADLIDYLAWEAYDMPMMKNNPYRLVMEVAND